MNAAGQGGCGDAFGPLFAGGREATFAAGEILFTLGESGDRVYFVREGTVRIGRPSVDGRELTLAFVGRGEIVGEVALLDGGERTATATAQSEVKAVELTRTQFLRAIAERPEHALRLIVALCQRLRGADRMAEDLTFLGVKERLESLRARLEEGNQAELFASLTHQELAETIGTTRESVTRALAELRREGK